MNIWNFILSEAVCGDGHVLVVANGVEQATELVHRWMKKQKMGSGWSIDKILSLRCKSEHKRPKIISGLWTSHGT